MRPLPSDSKGRGGKAKGKGKAKGGGRGKRKAPDDDRVTEQVGRPQPRPLRDSEDLRRFVVDTPRFGGGLDVHLSKVCGKTDDINRLLDDLPADVFFKLNALLASFCPPEDSDEQRVMEQRRLDDFMHTIGRHWTTEAMANIHKIQAQAELCALLRVLQRIARIRPSQIEFFPLPSLRKRAAVVGESHEISFALERLELLKEEGGEAGWMPPRECGHPHGVPCGAPDDEEREIMLESMSEGRLMPSVEELREYSSYADDRGGGEAVALERLEENRKNRGWVHANEGERLLYQHTHYMLLRAEMMLPLQEALADFLSQDSSHGVSSRHRQYVTYQDVVFKKLSPSSTDTPMVRVGFQCPFPIDFSAGKRLIFGSLVALLKIDTDSRQPLEGSLVFAVIEESNVAESTEEPVKHKQRGEDRSRAIRQKQGEVGLSFLDDGLQRFDFSSAYIMLESPAYFQAFRPVFKVLRDPDMLSGMPLANLLLGGGIRGRENLQPPAYLQDVSVDISALYTKDSGLDHTKTALEQNRSSTDGEQCTQFTSAHTSWPVLNPLSVWPEGHGLTVELDPAQRRAMDYMLRQPVALVQGPPGTGKSYLGVKFARLARQALDKKGFSEPILAITLTNHALDQFMEDLLPFFKETSTGVGKGRWTRDFEGGMVRFGGRCKSDNEALLNCQVRQRASRCASHEQREREREIKSQISALCASADRSAFILSSHDVHLALFLVVMPHTLFSALLEPQGFPDCYNVYSAAAMAGDYAFACVKAWLGHPQDLGSVVDRIRETGKRTDLNDLHVRARWNCLKTALDGLGTCTTLQQNRQNGITADPNHGAAEKESERHEDSANEEDENSAVAAVASEGVTDGTPVFRPAKRFKMHLEDVDTWRLLSCTEFTARLHDALEGHVRRLLGRSSTSDSLIDQCREKVSRFFSEVRPTGNVRAVWRLPMDTRVDMFHQVRAVLTEILIPKIARRTRLGVRKAEELAELRRLLYMKVSMVCRLVRVCEKKQLIGMTSNFAATNRELGASARLRPRCICIHRLEYPTTVQIHRLRPRVLIVEEAGELLEPQLMACLTSPQLQHVVLIGDHQQLRPKVNVYALAKQKNFDVSLFERLVNMRTGHAQLATQLRMRPDISQLTKPFYEQTISDHPRTQNLPFVRGVGKNVFFLTHNFPENQSEAHIEDSQGIKSNSFEADFVARLALYLVHTGAYVPADITLLTPYMGQKRLIRQKLDPALKFRKGEEGRPDSPGCRVMTIDDYQGEENKIVLLSLVRSNAERRLGFVGIENRVIVALSRAKEGMFIVGDPRMLEGSSSWQPVLRILRDKAMIGPALQLYCQKHPDTKTDVHCAEDIDRDAQYGGCKKKCMDLLPTCGHVCPLTCHIFDHSEVKCTKPCTRPRRTGCKHKCRKICYNCVAPDIKPGDPCPSRCTELVAVKLPCGHTNRLPCHEVTRDLFSVERIACTTKVTITLACGHKKTVECSMKDSDTQCTSTSQETAPCGHRVLKECHTIQPCRAKCEKKFPCGHSCDKPCSPDHDHLFNMCPEPCGETLPCGHPCQEKCGRKCTQKCTMKCSLVCTHGYRCSKECHELCVPCTEKCSWTCEHFSCSKLCHEDCDRPRCSQPCRKVLGCGHPCAGACGEPCSACPVCEPDVVCSLSLATIGERDKDDLLYTLPDCGHTFYMQYLDMYMATADKSGDHVAIKLKVCPNCRQPIMTAPRYNNEVKKQLRLLDAIKRKTAEVTAEERREISQAMGGGAGHWFACPNGHPYYIGDCGGGNQLARCPECNAQIGGLNHTLTEGNRFVGGEFTGAENSQPNWPTMRGRQ